MTEENFKIILERSYSKRIQQYATTFLTMFKSMSTTDELMANIQTNKKGQVCFFLFSHNQSKTEGQDWSCLLDSVDDLALGKSLTEAAALAEINQLAAYQKALFPLIINTYKQVEKVSTVQVKLRNVLGYDHSIAIKSAHKPILFLVMADSFILRQRLKNRVKD